MKYKVGDVLVWRSNYADKAKILDIRKSDGDTYYKLMDSTGHTNVFSRKFVEIYYIPNTKLAKLFGEGNR